MAPDGCAEHSNAVPQPQDSLGQGKNPNAGNADELYVSALICVAHGSILRRYMTLEDD